MKRINLSRSERIVAVVPETCTGPGWANQVVHIHIVDVGTNIYRYESQQLHENECSAGMMHLFKIGALVCAELDAAVQRDYSVESVA